MKFEQISQNIDLSFVRKHNFKLIFRMLELSCSSKS